VVHRIFDPVEFSCPVTLIPKLLIQNSWNCKNGWDEILPEEMRRKYEAWIAKLPLLSEVEFPDVAHPRDLQLFGVYTPFVMRVRLLTLR
jgi:hypothetical protein